MYVQHAIRDYASKQLKPFPTSPKRAAILFFHLLSSHGIMLFTREVLNGTKNSMLPEEYQESQFNKENLSNQHI